MSLNPFGKEEPKLGIKDKGKMFFAAHWRGFLIFVFPLILIPCVIPTTTKPQWILYTLLLMALYSASEVIPLPVIGLLPIMILPLASVVDTLQTCRFYMNDPIMLFMCSLMLTGAIEQSGVHKRLAYFMIRVIGYSHKRLLLCICFVTMFISMWITNTATVTLMVPIIFALLKALEWEGWMSIYEYDKKGNKIASNVTTCYFCTAAFSATIGGIGTLIGTVTNMAFKSLFVSQFKFAPEYLTFAAFSAFAVPVMIVLELVLYIYMCIMYLGLFRGKSKAAKSTQLSARGIRYAKTTVADERKKLGKITCWEIVAIVLFILCMLAFFLRDPGVFGGWSKMVRDAYEEEDEDFIRDSATGMAFLFLMFLLPSTNLILKNFTAKTHETLPKQTVPSVIDWKKLNADMPYSFIFLLGGGAAVAKCAKIFDLNEEIGTAFESLSDLPKEAAVLLIILIVMILTNFASNVAVINLAGPVTMALATKMQVTQLWYILASGFASSYCFMLAVGTPANLVVKVAANISTKRMLIAGIGPTVASLIITWAAVMFYAPIIWPILKTPKEATWTDIND